MDIQTTGEVVKWGVNIITLILLIVAASRAIKKKNDICLGAAIVGNLLVYYFTKSPLLCGIVSIACIIWASRAKTKGSVENTKNDSPNISKQTLKSSKAPMNPEVKRMVKPGPIIGLIIGILMAGFPIVGFMMGEGSLSDPQGKMMGFGFIIFGAFMIIVNIIVLATGKENLLASDSPAITNSAAVTNSPAVIPAKASKESSSDDSGKVRCRFCNKQYSSEYNGCPYCKKK
ncbi:MAG: hypothetical protein V1660_02125 [archaeon]